jgi:2-keto-4-pentenoate hydratase/2-oxohepta-3-ene-1,7-dioic acid hydratase in catechol pathway
MAKWVRFNWKDQTHLGTLDGDNINVCGNELYAEPDPTGEQVALSEVELLAPFTPNSILALWNNFYERAEAEGQTIPANPLYFMKPVSSVIGPKQKICRPQGYRGGVKFEAEIGVVMGRHCSNIGVDEVDDVIFGYTCVNDVTAAEFLFADKAFQQWTLAKGFDSFCPLGPCIDTDIDPDELRVQAIENGEIRQDYPVSDMIYSPRQIVSMISRYQTLVPGDLIVCGTSVGASPMQPGCEIQVSIPGLGTLVNHFDDQLSVDP